MEGRLGGQVIFSHHGIYRGQDEPLRRCKDNLPSLLTNTRTEFGKPRSTMQSRINFAFFFLFFVTFTASLVWADCPSCDSYSKALRSCGSSSANTTVLGSSIDDHTVHCMCSTSSNSATLNSCHGCIISDSTANLDLGLNSIAMSAWTYTCKAGRGHSPFPAP